MRLDRTARRSNIGLLFDLRTWAWIAVALLMPPLVGAQSPAAFASSPSNEDLKFDSVSIRRSSPDEIPRANFPLGPGPGYTSHTGGLFQGTAQTLVAYIAFAYQMSMQQGYHLLEQVPNWVASDRFDIEAKTSNPNPTKDQMRVMVRALLMDRFKLKVHTDPMKGSVLELSLVQAGKLGPKLQPHVSEPPCSNQDIAKKQQLPLAEAGLPANCGAVVILSGAVPEHMAIGARDVDFSQIVSSLAMGRLDHPVADKTGLHGRFDYTLEWETGGTTPSGANLIPGSTRTDLPFQDALREQLGLKLEPTQGEIPTIVVDHIIDPTKN